MVVVNKMEILQPENQITFLGLVQAPSVEISVLRGILAFGPTLSTSSRVKPQYLLYRSTCTVTLWLRPYQLNIRIKSRKS
jgi:hypothetical protein